MTATNTIAPRVFGVWWKDLERWVIPTRILLGQSLPAGWTRLKIGMLVRQVTERIKVEPDKEYKMAGVKWYGEGVFHRETVQGDAMSASQVTPLFASALIYNRLFAWKASFAVVPPELADCYVSNEFPQFITDSARILPEYLYLFCTREATIRAVKAASTGSSAVSRNRFKEEEFLNLEISLPPLAEQKAIVARWCRAQEEIAAARERVEKRKASIDTRFFADLGLGSAVHGSIPKAFAVLWKEVERWGIQLIYLNCQRRPESKFRELLLSEVCKIGSGGTPRRSDKRYFGGSVPWVKTAEVRNEEITSTEEALTNEGLINSSAKVYPKGSLLIAMYGQGATRGRTAKLAIDAATNQACAVLSNIDPRIKTDFLWYFLMSQYESMRALASGNNQPNLNAEMIANLRIPLPPLALQRQIIERVAVGRSEIAREREAADRLAREINTQVEALILGTETLKGA